MKKTKKGLMLGILSVVMFALILAIGEKLYMSNKENKNITLEREGALEIKSRFKNIKEIKITDLYESSPQIENIDFDVVELGGNVIKENSITVGEFGSFSDNGLTAGSTKGEVKVIYTTGNEEIIEWLHQINMQLLMIKFIVLIR